MITINNLVPTEGTEELLMEKTLVPNEYALIDSAKRVFPTGLGRVKIASDIKNDLLRGVCQVKSYYTELVDGVETEFYVTLSFNLTGNAGHIRTAEQAAMEDQAVNNASQAIASGYAVLTALVAGVGLKPHVNTSTVDGTTYNSETDADGTGLTSADLAVRMRNPFVRAANNLEMIPDGTTLNGAKPGTGNRYCIEAIATA